MGIEKGEGSPWAVAVDLGGTGIKGALVNRQGQLLRYREVPTPAAGFDQVWPRIAGLISELRDDGRELGGNLIAGVGVGVPGALQPDTPDVVSWAPNLKWRDVPLGRRLREQSGLPVYLENDADLAAVGEHWQGAGREFMSFAVVTVGTGVGCGLVLDGRLYRGAAGTAGELGHMILLADGPECSCGRQGCLETLVAAPAVIRLARERHAGPGPWPQEARDVFAAAGRGEPGARAIVREVAGCLGWGFANL
ncbi:MAG: ROK family protein, partial [Heliobacteriaceae bacterium]|nr:ROK family protein [Heliobacteriaceae bacterium]